MSWRDTLRRVKHTGVVVESGPLQFGDQPPGIFFDADQAAELHLSLEIAICTIADLDMSNVAQDYIIDPLREIVKHIDDCDKGA